MRDAAPPGGPVLAQGSRARRSIRSEGVGSPSGGEFPNYGVRRSVIGGGPRLAGAIKSSVVDEDWSNGRRRRKPAPQLGESAM